MMRGLRANLRRFVGCAGGSYTVVVAIILPVIAGISGAAIDFYIYTDQQKQLQNVADSAALAAAREASLGGWSKEKAEAVVDSFIAANFKNVGAGSAVYTKVVTVDQANRRVSVTIDQDHYGYFVAGYFRHSPQIRVSSIAQASGETNICVIGLHTEDEGTISLDSNAVLSAPNCAVYSNSSSTEGMVSLSNSRLTAGLSCSAGGYEGAPKNYNKLPVTDCPVVSDPLASRPTPTYLNLGLPILNNKRLKDYKLPLPLFPGVYRGGLRIEGNSNVTLSPGLYVMEDGPLQIEGNSVVKGTGVGFYFTGEDSHFRFEGNAQIELEAPTSPANGMAGLLFFQDRVPDDDEDEDDEETMEKFRIETDFARKLVGTIYLPRGHLIIEADNDVADQSAYTAIVVRKLQLEAGPNLVLNTDYDETTVPVPDGLGPSKGELRLVK